MNLLTMWSVLFLFGMHVCARAHVCVCVCVYSRAVMGKAEGQNENWHGHVTALSVANDYRRLGLAATLMHNLEEISEK